MNKNYFFLLLVIFTFLCGQKSTAQIIATDDTLPGSYSAGGWTGYNVFDNDTLNGAAVMWNDIQYTTLSTTNPGVYVQYGFLYINSSVPLGTYTLTYQLCAGSICDTATVTVTVCNLAAPTITSINALGCFDSPGISVTGLPTGNWTLTCTPYWLGAAAVFNGSGPTATFNLVAGNYRITLTDSSGCHPVTNTNGTSVGYFSAQAFDNNVSGTYQDSNSNNIIDLGDRVIYQCSVTNSLDCPITITISDEINETVFTTATSISVAAGATDSSVMGYYMLTTDDITTGSVNKWLAFNGYTAGGSSIYAKGFATVPLAVADGIVLRTFIDTNVNGQPDNGEFGYPYGNYTYEINQDGVIHNLYTNDGIAVIFDTNPANSYDINYIPSTYSCQYIPNTVSYQNVTVPVGSGLTNYNFALTPNNCKDASVYIYPTWNGPRPGFLYHETIDLGNLGNQTITSGTLTYTNDSALTLVSVNPPATVTITPTGFTYDFVNLLGTQHRYFDVTLQVPPLPTVALGQLVTSTATVTTADTEATTANNDYTLYRHIMASYDPNDKSESHGGQILFADFSSDDFLTYTIRFENTGNAEAFDVVVDDLLDAQLDETSIRMIASSHNYQLERIGNHLVWKFRNINLPPSTDINSAVGKGYLIFQVKPKPGYAIGDVINNTSEIYFDTNPAITTNTVQTEFVSVLKTADFETAGLQFYPNPVRDLLQIEMQNMTLILVSDILGKTLKELPIDANFTTVDLSGLSDGIYLLTVKTSTGQKTIKILKQ